MKTLLTILLFQFFGILTFAQNWKHYWGSNHLPNDTVVCMSQTANSLLVGTKGGVAVKQNGTTSIITSANGLASDQVDLIAGSNSGQLMMYHRLASALTWIDSIGNVQTYSLGSVLSDTIITNLVYNDDGNFYINGADLSAFKDGSFTQVSDRVHNMVAGPNAYLYTMNTFGDVVRYKNSAAVDTILADASLPIGFTRFMSSNRNEVYFTAVPGATYQVFQDRVDSLSSQGANRATSLHVDSEGQLWRLAESSIARGKIDYEITSSMSINHAFRGMIANANDSIYIAVSDGYVAAPLDVKFNPTSYLEVNNFSFKINPDGSIGSEEYNNSRWGPQGFNAFTCAKINDVNVLFASGLWLAGVTSQGDTVDAGERYNGMYSTLLTPYDFDLSAGPRASTFNHGRNYKAYITSSDTINSHLQNSTQPGYSIPDEFGDWPTHGTPQTGEAECLAPFIDADGDGKYIPQAGDYPQIRGDVAAYTISNDDYLRQFYPNNPMGVEIHRMYYGYKSSDQELSNTIFLNIRIVNRGNQDFTSFKWGIYNNFIHGNAADNYLGCDTSLNMTFVYNGDDNDEDNGGFKGFGMNPPAFGVMMLNEKMKSHLSLRPNTNNPFAENPQNSVERYNLLSGKSRGGTELSDTLLNGDPSTYMYPGNPLDPNSQSELNLGNAPYDRLSLMGGDNHTLSPGDTLEFDLAFVFAENPGTQGAEAYSTLAARAAYIKGWYDNQSFEPWQTACTPLAVGTQEESSTASSLKIYPNPTENELRIRGIKDSFQYNIFNLQGQLLQSGQSSEAQPIQLLEMNSGVYFIQINQKEVRKFIVR